MGPTGSGASKPADGEGIVTSPEGISLNFIDTDIRSVLSSVLGDALGLTYTVDPSIKGTITVQSARALNKEDMLSALEAALELQGIAVVGDEKGYSVVPLKEAARHVRGLRTPETAHAPGFGIEVVPLKFTSASDMEKVLKPFAPEDGIVRVDEARNLLILAGSGPERAAMLQIVQQFDVDFLAGMSYAMYPVEYVDAKELVDELKEIFIDTKSPLNGVVRLIPLPRLNTVLVASSQSTYLQQIGEWIKRLDLGGASPGRRIYVYDIQNGRATDLANTLNQMFGLASPSASSTQPSQSSLGSNSTIGQSTLSGISGGSGFNSGSMATTLPGSPAPAAGYGGSSYPPSTSASLPSGGGNPGSAVSLANAGLRIVPSEENNALLILASPSEFGVLETALKRLDSPPRQVLIQATLAEVTLTDEIKFGIQWFFHSGKGVGTLSDNSNGTVSSEFPGFSYFYTGSMNIAAVLNALEAITKVKVISSPELMVLNNRSADIEVGDQVPILTQQAVSVSQTNAPIVNSVAQQTTGVILHVVPRVNKSGMVTLDIEQEVSEVVPTTSSSINSPTIQERKVSSTVNVRDGETIALGGVIRDSLTTDRSGLPWLSRIPVLGWLFGATDRTIDRTELIILIKPQVVQNDEDLNRLTEDMREQFQDVLPKDLQSKPHDGSPPRP